MHNQKACRPRRQRHLYLKRILAKSWGMSRMSGLRQVVHISLICFVLHPRPRISLFGNSGYAFIPTYDQSPKLKPRFAALRKASSIAQSLELQVFSSAIEQRIIYSNKF
jgi:hypothetical protein